MKCQKCGAELRDGAKFCDNCGAAVQFKKQCPKCGKIVDSNAIYCPFCNSSIPTPKKVEAKSKLADVEGLKNDFIKCPKCGNEYRATTPYCPNCGEKTAAVQQSQPIVDVKQSSDEHLKNYYEFKKCPKCGEINDKDALFCKKCNQALSDVPVDTKEKKTLLQIIKDNSIPILILFFAVFIIVAIGVVACNNINNKSNSLSPTEQTSNNDYGYDYYDDFDYTTYETFTEYEPPTTETPTEIETEEATTEMSDALHELYSDDNITLSYYQMHDYEYDPEEKRIEFCVENKTDKQLTIQSSLVSVNGISYKGNMSDEVLPNTKGIIEMNVYQNIPVDSPSSIGITINYFDEISGGTIDKNNIVIPEKKIN